MLACACVWVRVCLHKHASKCGWVCMCVRWQRTISSATVPQAPPTCFYCFVLLKQNLSEAWNSSRRLNWLSCRPQRSCFYLANSGFTSTCHYSLLFFSSLMWFLRIELRSSRLQGKHSAIWAISPVHSTQQTESWQHLALPGLGNTKALTSEPSHSYQAPTADPRQKKTARLRY